MSDQSTLPLTQRVHILTKTYAAIQTFFAHAAAVPDFDLDQSYNEILQPALSSDDRFQFGMIMHKWIAMLKNSHSWYTDPWLNDEYGQPLGFRAALQSEGWVVRESEISELRVGDIITLLNDYTMDDFFESNKHFINAANDEQARYGFAKLRYVLPHDLKLRLEDNTILTIDRTALKQPDKGIEIKWIDENHIAYIKIKSFVPNENETQAIAAVEEFRESETIIVDVRGNTGGSSPNDLVKSLMDRPYQYWTQSTPTTFGVFTASANILKVYGDEMNEAFRAYFEALSVFSRTSLLWPSDIEQPDPNPYTGRVLILTDGWTGSAAEDFTVPFKNNGRATIIGEHTGGSTGQPYFTQFENGISVGIGSKRAYFPDGSQFEGIGIMPDIEVVPSATDLRAGRDPVLEHALELATKSD
jgi:carboxyl-terminal processing protease